MLGLPLHNKHFEELYKEFDRFVVTKNYGKGKSKMYQACVREFLFFIETKGFVTIQQIKASEIIAYYEYIRERPNQRREGGLSESMIRHHLFSMRLFFDYLLETGEIQSSPARLPKFQIGKANERNICTVEEILQLYDACETKRDKALLSIAYGCGLRRTEIQNLNTTDVLLHKGMLIVREGKGNKSRTVPLSNNVIKDLKEYLIYERAKYFLQNNFEDTPAFFINNTGTRMLGDKLNGRLKELILKTNNAKLIRKEITLHCLRHSIATHLIDKGASIEFVQQLLGHAEIDTVHLYSKRRKQQLKIKSQLK
jgi:site-specific recombinase XerD